MQKAEREKLEGKIETKVYGHIDLPFLLLLLAISVIGLIMMFSASYASALQQGKAPTYLFMQQGLFFVIGLAAMALISRLNYLVYQMMAAPAFVMTIVLLILVLFIGDRRNGARRWIHVGFDIQPSEIAKLALVIVIAAMIVHFGKHMETFINGVVPFALAIGMVCGLVLIQPHLSGAIIIGLTAMILMFVGGVKKRYFAVLVALGGAMGLLAWRIFPHVQRRLAVWLDPFVDPLGDGFQSIQSLYAIGPGGLFGLGLGQSRQKFLYLPERHNDYVFAIVCEEIGFIGALLVLTLFVMLIARGYWIALHARDKFGSLLCCGIITLLALQTFLNVAVVTNLLPATGVSMPFFSYGGSALLMQLASMGMVLNVSRYIPAKKAG